MSVCTHCIMHVCDICVLYQYIVHIVSVSDCISMLRPQLHTTIILSARFFVPCPAAAPAFLLNTCNVLGDLHLTTKRQCGRCIERGGRCIEPGALSTSEFVSSSGSAEVASHASTSTTAQQVQGWLMPAERLFTDFRCVSLMGIGDIGFDMFHISERCPLIFE